MCIRDRASHRPYSGEAGKLAPHCGAFLGGTFTPGTSINSPVAMNHGETGGQDDEEKGEENNDNDEKRRREGARRERDAHGGTRTIQRDRGERAQLFNKLVAYELPFAYLLFESFGRQSCVTPSTSQREDP